MTRDRSVPVLMGLVATLLWTGLVVLFAACRGENIGPRRIDVHFIGPVKLYQASSRDAQDLQGLLEEDFPLPRYVVGRAPGFLFAPQPREGRQCDPFARGTLEMSLARPGSDPIWSVRIPLRSPAIQRVDGGYRLSPVPERTPSGDSGNFSPLRMPDEPGLWRFTFTWRCGQTSRGRRVDEHLVLVQKGVTEAACDPRIWDRLDAVGDRPPGEQLPVFEQVLREPLCPFDRLWVTKYHVQCLKEAGADARAEAAAQVWAELAEQTGYVSEAVLALNAAHEAARDQGALFRALSYLDRSLELAVRLDYQVRFPEEYFSRAWIFNRLGKLLPALEMAAEAETWAERVGKPRFRLEATRLKLSLLQSLGHHRAVNRALTRLLADIEKIGSATLYNNVGWLLLRGVEAGVPLGGDRNRALDQAETLFRRSLDEGGPNRYRAGTLANLAYVALLRGDLVHARAWTARAAEASPPSDPELHLFLDRVRAEVSLADGAPREALARFERLEQQAGAANLVAYAGAAAFGRGEALRAMGALEAAVAAYDRALSWVEANEAVPSPIHEATMLAARVPWEARDVQTRLDLHRALDALDLVERCAWARWRSQVRTARRRRLSPEESVQARALEEELDTLDRTIASRRRGGGGRADGILGRLEARREAVWARVETLLGDTQPARPPPLDLAALRAQLPEHAVVIRPAVFPDELVVWTVSGKRFTHRRIPLPRSRLETLVGAWSEACRTDHPDHSAGSTLARMLLQDVGNATCLIVIADGVLRAMPWSALPVAGRPAVARCDVVVAPSLFWRTRVASARGGDSLIVVDPNHDLAGADQEGDLVARLLPSPILLAQEAVSRESVLAHLRTAARFHYAGHARVDEDRPFLSCLELARGECLSKMDIRGLRLPAPLVFLNACGAGRVAREGGGTLGIADGFVASGARAVISTLWDVPDRESARVADLFYRELEKNGGAVVKALGHTVRALAAGRAGPAGARVSLWAAYQVLGDAWLPVGGSSERATGEGR